MKPEKDEIQIDRYILTSLNQETGTVGIKLQEKNGSRTLSMTADKKKAFPVIAFIEPFAGLLPFDFPPILLSDFLKNILDALGNEIIKIVIDDLEGEQYSAKLHLLINGQTGFIDIDMQDALSLIARTNTPLYVKEKVFDLCDEKKHSRINWYDLYEKYAFDVLTQMPPEKMLSYPVDELNIFLEKSIEKEEYLLAAKIKKVLAEKNTQ
jgi:bifunctional DNase/RNase